MNEFLLPAAAALLNIIKNNVFMLHEIMSEQATSLRVCVCVCE
jgi:hypothetical protein